MMRAVVRHVPWGNIMLFLAGGALMLVAAPLVIFSFSFLQTLYDAHYPVAKASIAHIERVDPQTLRLQLWITRQRDCEVMKMVGLTGTNVMTMQGATTMRREDGSDPISYPIGVRVLSRPWILSPTHGPKLWVYGYYDCDDRVVKSPLVSEVPVP